MSAQPLPVLDGFAEAREEYDCMEAYLVSKEARSLTHSELEREIEKRGRELMRRLLEAHLEIRGPGEAVGPVEGSDGVVRDEERLHKRGLETIFGEVEVKRLGYGAEGSQSLHPLDADLNLPAELYSHQVRRRVAEQAAKGSFDSVVEELSKTTGAKVGKRQVEEMTARGAQDFEAFYEEGQVAVRSVGAAGSILVISTDGKGVVMRRQDLREATRKRAEATNHKLKTRLTRGEKANAKRMATVAAVYTIAPFVRKPEDIVQVMAPHNQREKATRPRPEGKRVWASLERSPEEVIEEAIREARTRDPEMQKEWVGLVDGSWNQLKMVRRLFRRHGVRVRIILDFIHVAERVWKAGRALKGEASPELDRWVSDRLLEILRGRSGYVAGGIRRSGTLHGLSGQARESVDKCADYLLKNRKYLEYDEYLAKGWPIATGVIEGACRHLIKDRMDITGARWSMAGAEAVIKLRALWSSGDFDDYWRFHERQEYQRNHASRYADGRVVPVAGNRPALRRVK